MQTPSSSDFYHPSLVFFRIPLLSISRLVQGFTQLADTDRLTVLANLLSQPHVAEALYLASPTLLDQAEPWLTQTTNHLSPAVELALWKYLLRMSSRCTPFGLFAGYVVGQVGNQSGVELTADYVQATTRLDAEIVAHLQSVLTADPAIRQQVRYRLNESLYQVGQQYRYSEFAGTSVQRLVQLTSLDATDGVQAVVNAYAAQMPSAQLHLTNLVGAVEQLGYDRTESTAFINDLIDAQLLLGELEPAATGFSTINRINSLGLAHLPQWWSTIGSVTTGLSDGPLSLKQFRHLTGQLQQLPVELLPVKSFFQTDANWQTQTATMNSTVLTKLGEQLSQLLPLRREGQPDALNTFMNRFHDRFGEQTIPLLTALDPDIGVRYGHASISQSLSLLQGLAISIDSQKPNPGADRLDKLRLSKLLEALRNGKSVVELTDSELTTISSSSPQQRVACSWYAHGTLLANRAADIDQGKYQFQLRSVGGPSALNLMGRFALDDESLTQHLRQLADWEQKQYPDTILAELVHLPTDRIGNVVSRPTLRPYEIPYLTPSSVDEAHTIALNDLVIATPRGQEILLFSKRLGKRIIPRLSTAHNFHHGDDVYRFLCDLQHHDQSTQLSWSWGTLGDQPFLPRVIYQNIIVARAQWVLPQTQLANPQFLSEAVTQLRERHNIPQWVAIQDGDNELMLDLNVPVCQRLLYDELSKPKTTKLVEWLATPDKCWVNCGQDRFTSEVVIPFGNQSTYKRSQTSLNKNQPSPRPRRHFPPGSEWLYVKVYISERVADEFLTTIIHPLVHQLIEERLIDQWFFVRYADPEPHLRLRFHCLQHVYARVLDELNKQVAASSLTSFVRDIQLGTYERELERYGMAIIGLCEAIFSFDSQQITDWLLTHDGYPYETERWVQACRSTDILLTAFGLPLSQKLLLLRQLQQAYLTEHGGKAELRKQLNDHYRRHSALLGSALGDCQPISFRTNYTAKLTYFAKQISDTLSVCAGEVPSLTGVLSSLLHMNLNRLFPSNQRQAELVVYHFMARYYESQKARQVNKLV